MDLYLLQSLRLDYCRDALPISSSEVTLVDEHGLVWVLHLSYEYGLAPNQCVLMSMARCGYCIRCTI